MKLRNKILIYTFPLILFPLILLALANYYFVERANEIQKVEANNRKINEAIFEIKKEIQDAKDEVKFIARTLLVTDYLQAVQKNSSDEPKLKENLESSLQGFFSRNPYYLEIALFSKDGEQLIKLTKLTQKKDFKNSVEKDIFNESIRNYTDNVSQLTIQKFDNNIKAIPFSFIVIKDRFIGVAVLKISSEALERPLKSLVNSGLCSFMFDNEGDIFAGQKIAGCEKKVIGSKKLNEITKKIMELDSAGSDEFKFTIDTYNSDFLAVPVYFTSERLTGTVMNKEKWFLGIREIELQKSPLNRFSVLFFSVLAIAIGLLYFAANFFAKKLTNPIEKVNFATIRIARGESISDLNIKSGDEIEDLAAAIQQMNVDLKNYQKRLVQSAKLATMGEMTARISHEIQNRVSGISLWVQYLDSELSDNEEIRGYLDEMKQGLNGFTDLLANLKSYYRTPDLDLSKVDLNRLIENTLQFVKEEATENNISINLNLAKSLPSIQADEEKLKGVVLNLIKNAIEAIGENGKIQIETEMLEENEVIILTVTDNGNGISQEDLSQVFYPFYTTKSDGSGLGLAITSNLVSAHKGKIEVKSEIGKGTTFKVLLPKNT